MAATSVKTVDDVFREAFDDKNDAIRVNTIPESSSLPAGTNNIGDVDIASTPTGASATQVQGTVAHDAAAANNPILLAARANANEPSAVSSDNDVVHLWADLFGRLIVVTGHPNPEAPVNVQLAAGNNTVITAPGASLSIYVNRGSINNRAGATRLILLQDGAGGTTRWRMEIKANAEIAYFDFGSRGWKLTANTSLNVNSDGGSVEVNVTEYYIAA